MQIGYAVVGSEVDLLIDLEGQRKPLITHTALQGEHCSIVLCLFIQFNMVAEHGWLNLQQWVLYDKTDYDRWKKDLDWWTAFTDLPKAKLGFATHLYLADPARQDSSELNKDQLKSDGGIDLIQQKSDWFFHQDANWKCFNT